MNEYIPYFCSPILKSNQKSPRNLKNKQNFKKLGPELSKIKTYFDSTLRKENQINQCWLTLWLGHMIQWNSFHG